MFRRKTNLSWKIFYKSARTSFDFNVKLAGLFQNYPINYKNESFYVDSKNMAVYYHYKSRKNKNEEYEGLIENFMRYKNLPREVDDREKYLIEKYEYMYKFKPNQFFETVSAELYFMQKSDKDGGGKIFDNTNKSRDGSVRSGPIILMIENEKAVDNINAEIADSRGPLKNLIKLVLPKSYNDAALWSYNRVYSYEKNKAFLSEADSVTSTDNRMERLLTSSAAQEFFMRPVVVDAMRNLKDFYDESKDQFKKYKKYALANYGSEFESFQMKSDFESLAKFNVEKKLSYYQAGVNDSDSLNSEILYHMQSLIHKTVEHWSAWRLIKYEELVYAFPDVRTSKYACEMLYRVYLTGFLRLLDMKLFVAKNVELYSFILKIYLALYLMAPVKNGIIDIVRVKSVQKRGRVRIDSDVHEKCYEVTVDHFKNGEFTVLVPEYELEGLRSLNEVLFLLGNVEKYLFEKKVLFEVGDIEQEVEKENGRRRRICFDRLAKFYKLRNFKKFASKNKNLPLYTLCNRYMALACKIRKN